MKPPGRDWWELRNVAIVVHNYRPNPVQVRGWQHSDCTACINWVIPNGWDWSELPGFVGGSHASKAFYGTVKSVAVQIGTDRVVDAWNRLEGLPVARNRTGAWGDHGGVGGEDLQEAGLWVWSSIHSETIKVTRVDDTDEHILFSVDLT